MNRVTCVDTPLGRIAPGLAAIIPRIPLGSFPTPVETFEIGTGSATRAVLVKRDDLCTDTYAGNKVRKLEFLLAEARARDAHWLITAGAAGSHHAFATAYHGQRHGFRTCLVLFAQPENDHVRAMLRLHAAAGAEIRWASRIETVPYGLWRARYAHRRDRPCMIPPGGSNDIGTLGFVNAGLELAEQTASGAAPLPTSVHAAAGTLGTVAGLAIGLAWAGLNLPVIATRITSRLFTNEQTLAMLVKSTLARLRAAGGTPPSFTDVIRLVRMDHGHFGTGYGVATVAGTAALESFARAGLTLDDTYTAKAAAALLARGAAGDDLPLFWHTLSAVHPPELLGPVFKF